MVRRVIRAAEATAAGEEDVDLPPELARLWRANALARKWGAGLVLGDRPLPARTILVGDWLDEVYALIERCWRASAVDMASRGTDGRRMAYRRLAADTSPLDAPSRRMVTTLVIEGLFEDFEDGDGG